MTTTPADPPPRKYVSGDLVVLNEREFVMLPHVGTHSGSCTGCEFMRRDYDACENRHPICDADENTPLIFVPNTPEARAEYVAKRLERS